MTEFEAFPKIGRISRSMVVTEQIDGTNGTIFIGDVGEYLVGSRNRWINTKHDNAGFATWASGEEKQLTTDLGTCGSRG